MGYYDQEFAIETKKRKESSLKWIGSAFIGAVVGSTVMYGALTYLPINEQQVEGNVAAVEASTSIAPVSTKSVALNVQTQSTNAVAKVGDTVVGIVNIQNNNMRSTNEEAGTGSGVIYKIVGDKAYIATNNHVVQGANKIEVSLADGSRHTAKVIGTDPFLDLAVVVVDKAGNMKAAELGSSESLKLGEPVLAIGNPLGLEFAGSVTQGIISGLNRSVPVDIDENGEVDWEADVIQTDAAINPGNSGGALVNMEGQVIGINSMKIAESSVEGIGFSIPMDVAKPIIDQLEKNGKVERPYLGVYTRSLSDISTWHLTNTLHLPNNVTEGILVENVEPLSPAANAGLKQYDVIVELDGNKITNAVDLRKYLYQKKKIGDQMSITYYRDGKLLSANVTLENVNKAN